MINYNDTLYILFGSRTGNAKAVAVLAHEYAQSIGYSSELVDMQEMDYQEITSVKNLLVIVSTHGEGEPPVQAEGFYEFIHSSAVSKVDARFAVLGLGDSSYRYFCQTGEDISRRLSDLGGQALLEVGKCDIDFEEQAKEWVLKAVKTFEGIVPVVNEPQKEGFTFNLKLGDDAHSAFKAELLEKKLLTEAGSSKKVLHVSLSLKNSGIDYLPGDAIGVFGTNSRSFVDELLKQLDFNKAYPVPFKGNTYLLKELLVNQFELTLITPIVVRKYADIVDNNGLNKLIEDEVALEQYASRNDVLDLVSDYPGNISVEQFVEILRSLSQRLYSVASSKSAVGEQADITVKIIENEKNERTRNGVCSSFLWNRLDVGDRVPVTIETISKFRLPDDDKVPVIMIGAGTGIAPFRGFLQERSARQAGGQNWLIFGERNQASDYLYKDELLGFKNNGLVNRLDTVFSRDQAQKLYVNQVIEQQAAEIMDWLNNGAVLYVCGSKDKLAVTVRQSLLNVIQEQKNLDKAAAQSFFDELKANKQYQEEVY